MAKYSHNSPTEIIQEQIDSLVFEALDLGIEPDDIVKVVEQSISWGLKKLEKEEFEA